jgi:hypothetical protein
MHSAYIHRRRHRQAIRLPLSFDQQSNPSTPGAPSQIVNRDFLGRGCRHCGGASFLTTPGKGPHLAGVTCVTCGRHGGWIPKRLAAELARAS